MQKEKLELEFTPNFASTIDRHREDGFRDPLFAFVTAPKESKLKMLIDPIYCRESICEVVRQDLRGVSNNHINLSKLHMVLYKKVPFRNIEGGLIQFRNEVQAGQCVVNAIEKHYGWPLTKVYSVTTKQTKNNKNAGFFYINASKRWIKSPVMLSLFTLLFRLSSGESKVPFKHKIKSFESLFKTLNYLCERLNYAESSYYMVHGKRWPLVLDNYRKLFGMRSMKSLYAPTKNSYFFTEGINTLCDESSKDSRLNKAFNKIVEEHSKKSGEKI